MRRPRWQSLARCSQRLAPVSKPSTFHIRSAGPKPSQAVRSASSTMEGKNFKHCWPKTLTGSSQNTPSLKRQPGRWFLEEGPLRVKTKHEDRFRPFRQEISNANANAFMQMSVFEPLIYIQRYSCDRHGPFLHVFHGSVFYVHHEVAF